MTPVVGKPTAGTRAEHQRTVGGTVPDAPRGTSLDRSPYRSASVSRPASLPPRDAAARQPQEPAAGEARVLFVNRTAFALEYDLQQTHEWGVSRVEVWGTRNGGQTWRQYAIDNDRRSPVNIQAPGPDRYGFRIVVQGVGSLPAEPPRPGDPPELQVWVDSSPPVIESITASQGVGYFGDHLIIRWRVADEHLVDRPVSLAYSHRPNGPWLPVASRLAAAGEYPWRLQRHLPRALYVRLQARDRAGNTATATTPRPAVIDLSAPSGRLRSAGPAR